jgi:hypothetical protein
MEGQLIVHVPGKKVTFLGDLDQAIKDYIDSYNVKPKAILVRIDNKFVIGDEYQGISIIHRNVIAPNYFWLLWNTKDTTKEAIWKRT